MAPVDPVTTLTIPGGNPAWSKIWAKARVEVGECSDGFTMNVQPAASAGASFEASMSSGEFHAVMPATTPTGSRRVYTIYSGLATGMVRPSILSARPA